MTVQFYQSTDSSAPVLYGASGSLITLLSACLVNGYGSKSAAGWSLAYTGTNLAVYKQGSGSNGYYLNVDDSASGSGGAKEALLRGFETATAAMAGTSVASGTQPFPTTSQQSSGVVCRKSTTADSTNARAWSLVADATCFYLFVDTGDYTTPVASLCFSFGDIFSYATSDAYSTMIMGRSAVNTNAQGNEMIGALFGTGAGVPSSLFPLSNSSSNLGGYMDRLQTGVGGAQAFGKLVHPLAQWASAANSALMGNVNAICPYPNQPNNGLLLSPIWLMPGPSGIRGYLKGLWAPLHQQPCAHRNTFNGTGTMSAKSFQAINIVGTSNGTSNIYNGQVMIETSNTWS